MEYLKRESENFLEYAERLLINRKDYDLDKSEVYEILMNEQASADHSRKCLTFASKLIEKIKNDIVIDNSKNIEEELNKKSTVEIFSDGSHKSDKLILMSQEQSKDVNFLLKAHGYDKTKWSLISARSNIWNTNNKVKGIETLYSSKIMVKPISEYVWNEEDIKILFSKINTNYKNKFNILPKQYEDNGDTLVVPIADFHYGLLSDEYSANNNYNLEIAEEIYYYTLNNIVNRVKYRKFEKVLFIIGNDFINADNINGTTTKGTIQDNSSSWFNTIHKATQLIINGIDILTEIAPVDVKYVMSNHDLHTMFGIMQTISAWYRNDDNVLVDSTPLPRKYCRIGKTLLCLSHDIKVKDALKIITTEAKDEWSQSEHIICLLAHLHQAMIYEKQGYLEIMRLPTISGWSRWSNDNGFIQIEKKNQSFIINNELGITDVINTIIK
jgi:hypothetical protein